jgi:hypothetical protein
VQLATGGGNPEGRWIAMTAPVTQEVAGSPKIAMTAPVVQQEGDRPGSYLVRFVMAADVMGQTLPAPTDAGGRARRSGHRAPR